MCCTPCSNRIIQIGGGGAPFTLTISAGSGPLPGGPVNSSVVVSSGQAVHFWSANTMDFNVTLGSRY